MRCAFASALVLLTCCDSVAAGQYKIAFANMAPLDSDVFIAAADGSDAKPFLPHPALDYNATLSDDGNWIIFTSERNGSADIYRARVDGTDLTRLTEHPAFDDQGVLSPDGRAVAFVSTRSGNADIWTLDLRTNALHNVTRHASGDFRPSWSPMVSGWRSPATVVSRRSAWRFTRAS